jgi:hypothetical protein
MMKSSPMGPGGMWWGRWDLLPALSGDISRDPFFLGDLIEPKAYAMRSIFPGCCFGGSGFYLPSLAFMSI